MCGWRFGVGLVDLMDSYFVLRPNEGTNNIIY